MTSFLKGGFRLMGTQRARVPFTFMWKSSASVAWRLAANLRRKPLFKKSRHPEQAGLVPALPKDL
jgi:hypothetical protein